MLTQELITYALGIVALLNVGVVVWNGIRKPQEKSEVNDAVFDVKFQNLCERLDTIKNNDLHELKGMFNTHITNQGVYEREMVDKYARLETKIDMLIKK